MLIREASVHDLEQVRAIFREYATWVDENVCFQSFEVELESLPGEYAAPRGRLLVVEDLGVIGCAAFRPLDPESAEVKRLYLKETARGQGLSRRLMTVLIDQARLAGYKKLRLDTLPKMVSAQKLYESLGFRDISRYNRNPSSEARFLELSLWL